MATEHSKTAANVRFPPHSVEKHPFAIAPSVWLNSARAPFLSGFPRLLRCRNDLRQFADVLGGCDEEEFVTCAAWSEPTEPKDPLQVTPLMTDPIER